jgi:SAM-dependent methyltransferase
MALSADDLDPAIWDDRAARDYRRGVAWMYAPEVLGPAVDALVALAGDGPALEFAIGTGRVGLALQQRGVEVHGIEFAPAMVDELRRQPGGESIAVVIGDMSTATTTAIAPGGFALVYLVFNTISNLLTQEQQVACFRNAAAHLAPGGAFVIETFVPELRRLGVGERFLAFDVSDEHLGFDEYDTVSQLLVSHHADVRPGHEGVFRSPHRYAWPSELDLMAQLAGLALESRWGDWAGAPFTAESTSHVSVWRKPT